MPRPGRRQLLAIVLLTVGFSGVAALAVLEGLTARGAASVGAVPAVGGAPAVPVLARSEIVQRVAGKVSVRPKGAARFTALLTALAVPDGSEVDASAGRVSVTVATMQPGQTATAVAYQGRFVIHQDAQAPGETHLILSGPLPTCARGAHSSSATAVARLAGHRSHKGKSRRLWVSEHGGAWGTGGHYVTTTVEGTSWLTLDECSTSRVLVTQGTVTVHDLIHHTTVVVSAGHTYAASKPTVQSRALMPPLGTVYTGQTGGGVSTFKAQVGKHSAVFGFFTTWGADESFTLDTAQASHARALLHISTASGYEAPEQITPAAIARGNGDGYLLALGELLSQRAVPVYVALMPEMNQTNNAYSAFNANGSSRGSSHSTSAFKEAWRRSVLILRGGSLARIDSRLRRLHMPPVHTSRATLPIPRVAFLWAPQTAGTPDIPANRPAAYYPGSAYVDIVGTDFYSAFPNFTGLQRMYSEYPSKPFGFNEWAMWHNGDPGFVKRFFAFIRSHPRIGMILYNQGLDPNGPFRLKRFPAAAREIRHQLASSRYLPYTPEWEASG